MCACCRCWNRTYHIVQFVPVGCLYFILSYLPCWPSNFTSMIQAVTRLVQMYEDFRPLAGLLVCYSYYYNPSYYIAKLLVLFCYDG